MIVSLDMKAMNRVLWIDYDNMTMKVEAGAVGKQVRGCCVRDGLRRRRWW